MLAMKNKVQLIGHVGALPEIKTTESGKKLARFSVATNDEYRTANGEKVKETQWHNVVAWGKTADIVEKYFSKGEKVVIEGKLVNRNYNDKNGNKRYITEVVVNDLMMLGSPAKA